LRDQDVPQTEHIGIEEYLSKQERERIAAEKAAAEKAAAENREFTMTAIKYETGEESAADKEGEPKKQAGFKPETAPA
jgi:colicin import membrane protein